MPRTWLTPSLDRRKGDRHKTRTRTPLKNHSETRSRWEKANVVAWDGEGATVDGVHIYNLMANSNGDYIHNDTGLSTKTCLDFMLANNSHSAINVIFSGGYDVNMILRDIDRKHIEDLWKDGRCHVRLGNKIYRLTYKPRKVFSVAIYNPTVRGGYEKSFVLWDVFGFYQSSFVKACRKWLIDDETIDAIDDMKQKRADFTTQDFDEILDYCLRECRLLVLLCQELIKALDGADIRLSRFDGAGAIAGAMLRKHQIKEHIDKPPEEVYRAIQMAYAGGRIEAVKVGNREGPIWKYDINSAYPAAMIQLPSWQNVTWLKEATPSDTAIATLVAVEWSYREDGPIYPLFFRTSDGTILFPRTGAGVYWRQEYEAMASRYLEGLDYEVLYAWNAYTDTPSYPLTWIQDAYNIRLEMKRQGNMAQETIKLGINSIYGKFAQQEGYVPGVPGVTDERWPTYHCLAWASMATSITRSRMYLATAGHSQHVIAYATDAVLSTRELPGLPVSTDLGEWSLETYAGCTVVQAGVYWLKDSDGEWHSKYRGFDPDSLHRDAVMEAWLGHRTCDKDGHTGEQHLPVRLTRFIGMGSALARTDFHGIWRTWNTEERCLDLLPQGKRVPIETNFTEQLCETQPTDNITPGMSAPYPVKWMDGDGPGRFMEGGVEVRTLEQEYEESFM